MLDDIGKLNAEISSSLQDGIVDESWNIILKQNWILRPDKRRSLLIEIDEDIGEVGKHMRMMPQSGIMVSLLDGTRTLKELFDDSAKLFELKRDEVKNFFLGTLKNAYDAFETYDSNKQYCRYNPENYIVDKENIDLLSTRMYSPYSIVMHIADSCVRNCIYCNVQKRTGTAKLSTEEFFDVIDQAKEMGVLTITMAGGEPFVRKDIPQLIERILNHGIYFGISTKANIQMKLAEKLQAAGLQKIQYSIDAPQKEIADLLAGSDGFFEEAIASIKNLIAAGIAVRTNSIVTPFNFRMVPDLIELLHSLGVYKVAFTTPSRSLHNGAVANALFLNANDGKWLEEKVNRMQDDYSDLTIKPFDFTYDYSSPLYVRTMEKYWDRAFCSAGRCAFLLLEDGNIVLCEECPIIDELIMGNVRENTIREIWDSSKITDFLYPPREKYKGTVCYECDEKDYKKCHYEKGRCWRESMKAYGQIWGPSPMCAKASEGMRVF